MNSRDQYRPTHGSPELDEDAVKLEAMGQDAGPTLADVSPGGWVIPDDPSVVADYWLTRREADTKPGYGGFAENIRVKYRWNGNGAWVAGYYHGRQRREPSLCSLHTNNGWRLEGPAHEVDIDIRPPLPAGKALVVLVRDRQCFHRIIDKADAAILDPLLKDVTVQ